MCRRGQPAHDASTPRWQHKQHNAVKATQAKEEANNRSGQRQPFSLMVPLPVTMAASPTGASHTNKGGFVP